MKRVLPRLFLRRDLRRLLAIFDESTVRFTGLAIGKWGIGVIRLSPRQNFGRKGDE